MLQYSIVQALLWGIRPLIKEKDPLQKGMFVGGGGGGERGVIHRLLAAVPLVNWAGWPGFASQLSLTPHCFWPHHHPFSDPIAPPTPPPSFSNNPPGTQTPPARQSGWLGKFYPSIILCTIPRDFLAPPTVYSVKRIIYSWLKKFADNFKKMHYAAHTNWKIYVRHGVLKFSLQKQGIFATMTTVN